MCGIQTDALSLALIAEIASQLLSYRGEQICKEKSMGRIIHHGPANRLWLTSPNSDDLPILYTFLQGSFLHQQCTVDYKRNQNKIEISTYLTIKPLHAYFHFTQIQVCHKMVICVQLYHIQIAINQVGWPQVMTNLQEQS